jgi:hypothetical protein
MKMEDPTMWIALTGDPNTGFKVCGPFTQAENNTATAIAVKEAYGSGFYLSIPLCKPSVHMADVAGLAEALPADAGYDENGTAVVFFGDLTGSWLDEKFYGPFRDFKAAEQWCHAIDCLGLVPITLTPVPVKLAA